jgi:acyl-CoA synthetase (AMP-forming)/AMP-acid ligase II
MTTTTAGEFNIAAAQEAIAVAYPDREAIVQGRRRLTNVGLTERTRRLANVLLDRGLGLQRERSTLAPHRSGQDHLAIYLHDGPEYLEAMLGAYKARVAPFNVNYRYVADELRYLLDAGRVRAVVYHGTFTPVLAEVLADRPPLDVLLRVDDGSGHPLLPGALDYETALSVASPSRPPLDWSPDDLYLLFTGGTTGLPKAVMWRQADIVVAGIGIGDVRHGREWASVDELVNAAAQPFSPRMLVAPPLMHGAGQWAAFQALLSGGTVVLPSIPHRRDPADLLEQITAHRATTLVIVGDAFARPIIDELRHGRFDTTSLRYLITGGAPLTPETRTALLELLPGMTIIDSVGSSESGTQGRGRSSPADQPPPGCFVPQPGSCVVDEHREKVLLPGHDGIGWLATAGRIPLGYLDDAEKTAHTFPVIDGRRMAVAGDRAVHRPDGLIQLLGRDSVTINSGGEKIFAEEVEAAILAEPKVADATVVGRPSERWGSEVVAVVSTRPGEALTADEVLRTAAQRLARYKLPKQVVFVDHIVRSPAGKADYRWARDVAAAASVPAPDEA